jgi:hypothetical protein
MKTPSTPAVYTAADYATWLSANPSAEADHTALTVLGTVTPRVITTVDTTQSAAEDDIIVDQLEIVEDGKELADYSEEADEIRAREREAKRKSLREQIATTGQGMRRMLVSEPIKSYFASPLEMEGMSIEDIMREIPPEDLKYVGSVEDRVYMPVSFVQKWVLPTIRVEKALKESQDGKLPGGMEPAFLASIFDQSVMDFNNPVSTNLADNRALRSMVMHTKDDTTHQFVPMEEGAKGQINGVKSALRRLKKVAQLPDENTLFQMKDVEIEIHNKEIDEAIEQYGDHATRDQNSMLLLCEQNALVGRLAWEQQIHICNLNERYLHLLEEKRQLVQTNDKHIYDSVNIITLTMMQLKESLK